MALYCNGGNIFLFIYVFFQLPEEGQKWGFLIWLLFSYCGLVCIACMAGGKVLYALFSLLYVKLFCKLLRDSSFSYSLIFYSFCVSLFWLAGSSVSLLSFSFVILCESFLTGGPSIL